MTPSLVADEKSTKTPLEKVNLGIFLADSLPKTSITGSDLARCGFLQTLTLSLPFFGFDGGGEVVGGDGASVPVVSLQMVTVSSGTEGNLAALTLFRDFRLFLSFFLGSSPNHSPSSSLFDGAEPKQITLQKEGQSVVDDWAFPIFICVFDFQLRNDNKLCRHHLIHSLSVSLMMPESSTHIIMV